MSQPVHELLSEAEVEALFVGVTTALCVTITLDGRALQQMLVAEFLYNEQF